MHTSGLLGVRPSPQNNLWRHRRNVSQCFLTFHSRMAWPETISSSLASIVSGYASDSVPPGPDVAFDKTSSGCCQPHSFSAGSISGGA